MSKQIWFWNTLG